MDALNERLANLGQAVAQAGGPDKEAIADARRRWARSSRPVRGRRWALMLAPAFAVAAVVVAVVVTRSSPEEHALTYTIDDARGERGQWIAAREPVQLRFSDGSQIDVARAAKVRVSAMDHRGSTIDVEQGALHADVTHRNVSSWRFRTGPYTVVVKGTRFDAAWNSTQERFTLDMAEGRVEVTGPLIPAPVTVTAGQSIVADVREKRFEIRSVRAAETPRTPQPDGTGAADHVAPPAARASDMRTPHEANQPAPSKASNDSSQSPSNGNAQHTASSSIARGAQPEPRKVAQEAGSAAAATSAGAATEKWRQYLAARAYSSAIAAAEKRGFDSVLAAATSAELYALSDAARYAKKLARAREALIVLRARFGEHGRTAFLLGRIAADQGDAAAAIEWFDRYLQEQPGGPFSETATGRLIELYKARDAGRARKLAERYLAAYPDGSYAALARALIGK